MKIEDVLDYYGSAWLMQKTHGLSHTNIPNWQKRGYIPIETQMRIEKLTDGVLKADLNDCKG